MDDNASTEFTSGMFSASVQIVFEFMDNGVKIIEFATYVRKMFYF